MVIVVSSSVNNFILLDSLQKFSNNEYKIDLYDNSGSNIAVIYNNYIEKYKNSDIDGILFINEKVNILDSKCFTKLINSKNPVVGILGSATFNMKEIKWNSGQQNTLSGKAKYKDNIINYGQIKRCLVLDDNFIYIKKDIFSIFNIKFDEKFNETNYIIDYCLQLNKIDVPIYTIDIDVDYSQCVFDECKINFDDNKLLAYKLIMDSKTLPHHNINLKSSNKIDKNIKIGIGIITCNRENLFWRCYNSIDKNIISELIVVNDGDELNTTPICDKYVRHKERQSVCISKNEIFRYLLDKGCDYIFTIEDDILVKDNNVFQKYIEASQISNIQHFLFGYSGPNNIKDNNPYSLADVNYGDVKISLNGACVGSFNMYTKNCLETVGMMDSNLNKNCWEHIEHTCTIIENELHPPFWWFADIFESWRYLDDGGRDPDKTSIVKSDEYMKDRHDCEIYMMNKHSGENSGFRQRKLYHVINSLININKSKFNIEKINHFLITVPVYNAEKYVKECIDSIKNQEYTNWKCVIVDDCSTDNTLNIINENIDDRFIVVCNKENKGALYNINFIIRNYGEKEDVIINVDGDDRLIGYDVFNTINRAYQNNNIWLTYGSLKSMSETDVVVFKNRKIEDVDDYRTSQIWSTSHLRTYRRDLFLKIKNDDLIDNATGEFWKAAPDLALMYPMIEMAGIERIKFINKIIYLYNNNNELNEHRVRYSDQIDAELRIRKKDKYLKLNDIK